MVSPKSKIQHSDVDDVIRIGWRNQNRPYDKCSLEQGKRETKHEGTPAEQQPTTHTLRGLLVGAGIDQQPRTVGATILSRKNQRRPADLRVSIAAKNTTAITHTASQDSSGRKLNMIQQLSGIPKLRRIQNKKWFE